MALKLITAPALSPVQVTDVADQVRADLTAETELVNIYIGAVTAKAEAYTKRALITQTLELSLDMFPISCQVNSKPWRIGGIALPMSPIQSIDSVKYIDPNGDLQTMSASDYTLTGDDPDIIIPVYGKSWPSARLQPGAVKIQYKAGYGDESTDVPAAIRSWILLNVASLYENREAHSIGRGQLIELNTMVDSLLDSFCMVTFQ